MIFDSNRFRFFSFPPFGLDTFWLILFFMAVNLLFAINFTNVNKHLFTNSRNKNLPNPHTHKHVFLSLSSRWLIFHASRLTKWLDRMSVVDRRLVKNNDFHLTFGAWKTFVILAIWLTWPICRFTSSVFGLLIGFSKPHKPILKQTQEHKSHFIDMHFNALIN